MEIPFRQFVSFSCFKESYKMYVYVCVCVCACIWICACLCTCIYVCSLLASWCLRQLVALHFSIRNRFPVPMCQSINIKQHIYNKSRKDVCLYHSFSSFSEFVTMMTAKWGVLYTCMDFAETVCYRLMNGYEHVTYYEMMPAYDAIILPGLLKRKCCHFEEISVTGCAGSCHFDNFRCSQWRKFRQNGDVSLSVVGFVTMVSIVRYVRARDMHYKKRSNTRALNTSGLLIQFAAIRDTMANYIQVTSPKEPERVISI